MVEEASIMGEFINRGIAIGFSAGVTAALLARRHPLTRKHPNLLGFGVAGTVDAISRDFRRPTVYNQLLKLDTPLGMKSQNILLSIRSGLPETETKYVKVSERMSHVEPSHDNVTVLTEHSNSWWEPPSEEAAHPATSDPSANLPYGVVMSPSSLIGGSRTWEDIRRENENKREESTEL